MSPAARLSIVAGGAAGTLLRWALSRLPDVGSWPTGTFVANLLGAAVLGALVGWLGHEARAPRWTPVTGGLLGATTTFSTFVVEVVLLWPDHPVVAVAYLVVSIAIGLAVAAGFRRVGEEHHATRPRTPDVAGDGGRA